MPNLIEGFGYVQKKYTRGLVLGKATVNQLRYSEQLSSNVYYLGNDTADQLVREATCQDTNLLMYVLLSHWKHSAWERAVSSWNTEFLASPKASWTKIFPDHLSTA
ncbi:hypothetical protein TNCV_2453111 [Trichonephila clavipes]|nr:hypothetical protein TNCV_2453111 [Trichonephila clavipes]